MKLATLSLAGKETPCVRLNDRYVPLADLVPDFTGDLATFLGGGAPARAKLDAALAGASRDAGVSVEDAVHLPPIPRPGKIVCLGLNYKDHAAEGGFKTPTYPEMFLRTTASLTSHGADIVRPEASERLDYEVELAIVVGKRTRHATPNTALDAVAGYSVFNDGSIRDYQLRGGQWTIGKNFDTTGGFGPDLVTADALPAGARGLRVSTRLNGQVVQNSNTDEMIFDVATTIVIVSECMTLEPGDVIIMGTPAGVGLARKPPLWMKPGDVCECEIEGIGVLRNPIAQEQRQAAA